jgi:eukaryotic-like serine/threonine-protein kinase
MNLLAGRYELLEQVGEGGMGVVWRARDENLERTVAIKLLRPFVARDPEQRRRFDREARTLAGLTNEHIVKVYDYTNTPDEAFLVMEYIDGGNLADTTFGRLPVSLSEAAAYSAPVAEALAYAHARSVVHRDLTPANILIERTTERVVTTDFGLARAARSAGSLTTAGVLIGTPEYWSPEQAMGRDTASAADMYALGCILFLLASGRLPFDGDDRLAIGLRRAHEDAPSLAVTVRNAPEEAVALVDSLLAREPAARPDAVATAAALARLAGRPRTTPVVGASVADQVTIRFPSMTVAPPLERAAPAEPPPSPRPRAHGRRRPLVASLVVAVVTVGVLILAGELRQSLRVPNVVSLRVSAARAQILHALPSATVALSRVYSTRVARGRVIRQRPRPGAELGTSGRVRLLVSRGSPFAVVPAVGVGAPPALVKASLAHSGFSGHFRYTPSWTVRKGTVIEVQPAAGTRLHRPATIEILVASGYPRAVVPDLENVDLASAQAQLAANHLRYRVVYRLSPHLAANQVLGQIPRAGVTVYQGTSVRLTVTRTFHWVKLFAGSGANGYESAAFTVPARWRIRYRLSPAGAAPALAQITWAREGELFGNGFLAATPGALRTDVVPDGGTYRLSITPYAGTSWYAEVDALE